MNGIVEIKSGKKTYTLRFSYVACMEFERRIFINPTDNPAKVFTDLVYSGLFGEAMRNEKPATEYGVAYDILDEISELDNYDEISGKIWDTYYQSKWGADFQKRLDAFTKANKKKAE